MRRTPFRVAGGILIGLAVVATLVIVALQRSPFHHYGTDALHSDQPFLCRAGMITIREFSGRAAGHEIPRLIEIAQSDSYELRVEALRTLSVLGSDDPQVLDVALSSLRDGKEAIPIAACGLLGHCGPAAIPLLMEIIQDQNESTEIRLLAFDALATIISLDASSRTDEMYEQVFALNFDGQPGALRDRHLWTLSGFGHRGLSFILLRTTEAPQAGRLALARIVRDWDERYGFEDDLRILEHAAQRIIDQSAAFGDLVEPECWVTVNGLAMNTIIHPEMFMIKEEPEFWLTIVNVSPDSMITRRDYATEFGGCTTLFYRDDLRPHGRANVTNSQITGIMITPGSNSLIEDYEVLQPGGVREQPIRFGHDAADNGRTADWAFPGHGGFSVWTVQPGKSFMAIQVEDGVPGPLSSFVLNQYPLPVEERLQSTYWQGLLVSPLVEFEIEY